MNADHSIACGVFTNDDGRCTCKEDPPDPWEDMERSANFGDWITREYDLD